MQKSEIKYRFTRINQNESFTSTPFLFAIFSISSQSTVITRDQYKPNFFYRREKSSFKYNNNNCPKITSFDNVDKKNLFIVQLILQILI